MEIEKNKSLKSPYNEYLWELYLQYINRYIIKKHHKEASLLLSTYLIRFKVSAIKSWSDVKKVSQHFSEFSGGNLKGGCPFCKTAMMLQELGILSSREEDFSIFYENAISKLDVGFRPIAKEYFADLIKRKRTIRTCTSLCSCFLAFQKWLLLHSDQSNILEVNTPIATDYLSSFPTGPSQELVASLNKFFSWALRERYIVINPFSGFKIIKYDRELLICSNEQIKSIVKYIKSNNSDPERALILALILYWGFNGQELKFSTIEIDNGPIVINLFRKNLSYQNKSYKREQVLKLPSSPRWINELQKRFIQAWKLKYDKLEKSFPKQLLLFSNNLKSNRPIGAEALSIRVYKATLEATGEKIPLSVIRRTSGHIYSLRGEASILTTLGWSRDYAADFVWRQRRIFRDNKKLKIESKVKKLN